MARCRLGVLSVKVSRAGKGLCGQRAVGALQVLGGVSVSAVSGVLRSMCRRATASVSCSMALALSSGLRSPLCASASACFFAASGAVFVQVFATLNGVCQNRHQVGLNFEHGGSWVGSVPFLEFFDLCAGGQPLR